MPTQTTEIVERISFDGPLSLWQAVLLGCVLAALSYWTLFHVPRGAKRRLAPVIWLLRAAVIAILAWMLLGPVNVTTYRQLTPRSLAILNDVSESMQVVDPPGSRSELRWRALRESGAGSELLAACDRAAVAAAAARDGLAWLLDDAERTAQPERARRKLAAAGRAARTAADQTAEVGRLLEQNAGQFGADLSARGKDVASGLAASRPEQLLALVPSSAAKFSLDADAITLVEREHRQYVQSARALGGLADRIAETLTAATPAGAQGGDVLARREKVNNLLKSGEERWMSGRDETARIRRYEFAREVQPVAESDATSNAPAESSAPKENGKASKTRPATGGFTNLSSALERINRDAGQAGIEAVLLFTDGRHNDPAAEDPRNVARSFGELPVYVVPVGTSAMQRDLVLHHVDAPTAVVEGDQVVVEGILSAFGCAGETCVVELSEGNTVVDREEIRIESDRRDYRIRLTTDSKGVGRHEFSMAASTVSDEAVTTNNAATFGVDIIDATLKILVAEDLPRWEYRYLVNLFERDERIQYEQLLFHPTVKGSGSVAAQGQLPRTADDWARYRVAILGDLTPSQLDVQSQRALAEYIADRGGTVILIAGPQAMPQAFVGMPLGDLLPVALSDAFDPAGGYELSLSQEARLITAMHIADQPGGTEEIWREMSQRLPIYSMSPFCAPKPTARTLIHAVHSAAATPENAELAFLCWQTVGRGRVVYLAAPAIYQLRLRHGDRFHYRFWGQLIRWAVARDLSQGSKTVKLATDRSRASVGENVQIVANLSGMDNRPVLNAEVRAQASLDGAPVSLIELNPDPNIPGRYLGEFIPADEGTLTLQAYGADVSQLLQGEGFDQPVETSIVVDPRQSTETEDTRANISLLSQIARLTHGQIVPPTAVEQLVELTDLEPGVNEKTVRGPMWSRWTFLILMCGVLTIEWTIRKTTGLP